MANLPGFTLPRVEATAVGVQLIPEAEIPDDNGTQKTKYAVILRAENNGHRVYVGRDGLGSGDANTYDQIAFGVKGPEPVTYPVFITREQLPNLYAYASSATDVDIDICRWDG